MKKAAALFTTSNKNQIGNGKKPFPHNKRKEEKKMKFYELTYTNMDGRKDYREFAETEKDEALRWAKIYKNMGDKNLKLVEVIKTEIEI